MTAIIGILNSQGIAIAADSAVTVTSGNIKKVYNKSNKIFTLSKYHPVGIAIFNSSQFMGIPWETLIKIYRKELKSKKFDTLEKYKTSFLSFLSKNLNYISPDYRKNNLYGFFSADFNNLKSGIIERLKENEAVTAGMSSQDANRHIKPIITQELEKFRNIINDIPKNPRIKLTLADFVSEYGEVINLIATTLENEIKTKYTDFAFEISDKDILNELFHGITKVENIFEQNSGLVFIGFGDKEIYPSSHQVTIGTVIKDSIRYLIHDPNILIPEKHDADIISYAQKDVSMTILKGIEPAYQNEINSSITQAFNTLSTEVSLKIPDPVDAANTSIAIKDIATTLTDKLEKHRHDTITQPLIDILKFMGKEDMAELAESLVSITSLKRKFTPNSSDESVGGPVDVAVITKGDGFIWLKRKNYFDLGLNRGFIEKYFD